MKGCKIRVFAPHCETVKNPNYFSLSNSRPSLNNKVTTNQKHFVVELPLRTARHEKFPIISCVSPLFFNEQWHMNIFSIEWYSYFGVTKQIYYYMSILEKGFQILKEYEKLGFIELQPWTVPNIGLLRTQSEFRNQITAHNDCYLLYREAADFIIVHDPDDLLLINKMSNIWNSINSFKILNPFIGNIMFERHNSYTEFNPNLNSKTFIKTLSNIRISNRIVWRKSVYLPQGIENINNHDASNLKTNYTSKFYEDRYGFFIHARNVSFIGDRKAENGDSEITNSKTFLKSLTEYLESHHLLNLQNILAKRLKYFLRFKELQDLTLTQYYHKIIDECYEKVYYHDESNPSQKCPSHYYCEIPKFPGILCVQPYQEFNNKTIGILSIHYLQKSKNVVNFDGCLIN